MRVVFMICIQSVLHLTMVNCSLKATYGVGGVYKAQLVEVSPAWFSAVPIGEIRRLIHLEGVILSPQPERNASRISSRAFIG